MPQQQGGSASTGGRIDGSLQKNALTTSAFALGVGWGDGTLVKSLATGSTDQVGQLTITSVGANQAQATATVVFTFADGAYNAAPFVLVNCTHDNALDTGRFKVTTVTTTAVTFTFSLLPVDTKIYILTYLVVAR